jgi:hypothetical protein
MARIKKAQGGSKVDNTRVKKPIIDPVRTTPTKYKYIDRGNISMNKHFRNHFH